MIFVDIGCISINLNHVITIHRTSMGNILIEYDVLDGDGPACLTLYGEEAEAFRLFWDHHNPIPGLTIFRT